MGLHIDWYHVLSFGWLLRKCRKCRIPKSKCFCKMRPSLTLEHIFYLEERKNKFGARNFRSVSDGTRTTADAFDDEDLPTLTSHSAYGDSHQSFALVKKSSTDFDAISSSRNTCSTTSSPSIRSFRSKSANSQKTSYGLMFGNTQYPSSSLATYKKSNRPPSQSDTAMISMKWPQKSLKHGDLINLCQSKTSVNSIRVSLTSERMSVDNNMGSLTGSNKLITYDNGFDEDEEANQRLCRWFEHSTNDFS